jgi:hypothetical protein
LSIAECASATAEAIELLTGLERLEQIGCSRVIIELDPLKLINVCNWTIEIWTPWSAITGGKKAFNPGL